MAHLWCNDQVRIVAFLVRDDPLDRYKCLCQNAERRSRRFHETSAVRSYINCNYNVRSEFTNVTDRKIRHQTPINQQPALWVSHGHVKRRQTGTGPNREGYIAIADREQPNAILMDIGMPVLNGLTATARIRQHYALRKIPIVALTAHSEADLRAGAEACGFTAYVTKPLDFDWLDDLIRRLLD